MCGGQHDMPLRKLFSASHAHFDAFFLDVISITFPVCFMGEETNKMGRYSVINVPPNLIPYSYRNRSEAFETFFSRSVACRGGGRIHEYE